MTKSQGPNKKPGSSGDLSQTVYSTETGDLRKSGIGGQLGQLLGSHKSGPPKGQPATNSSSPRKLTIRLEKKGRGGKTVTLVEHYSGQQPNREGLLRELKSHCGCGGSLEDNGVILIQGDQRDRIADYLRKMGLSPSVSGG